MPEILLCVNSDIGRGNTIGTRFERIARGLLAREKDVDIIGRANYTRDLRVRVPWYTNVLARGANALRIYTGSSRFLRRYEIERFDRFVFKTLSARKTHYRVAHLGEYLPRTMALLKEQGTYVFLDIPIAHPYAAHVLKEQGMAVGELPKEVITLVSQTMERADCLVVPSDYVERTLRGAGIDTQRVVVPFGVDAPSDITEEVVSTKQRSRETCTFLFAGAVNRRKGIPYLLRAWKDAGLSKARLLICGRVYQEVRSLLRNASKEHITLCGFSKLDRYFREAQIFVFPSLLEGSAKVVYEAMSYGLPVITTPNAGSVVEDGVSGFIVEPGDSVSLTQRIQELYDDPDLRVRMGVAAMRRARTYTWDRYVTTLIGHYTKLL